MFPIFLSSILGLEYLEPYPQDAGFLNFETFQNVELQNKIMLSLLY